MSNKTYDGLNDFFNIESSSVDVEIIQGTKKPDIEKKEKVIDDNINDIKKDYEYTRSKLYSIIEKGQRAIDGILDLAQETETPRAYEVAGQLIKNVSDATDKLMELQKKLKDVESSDEKGPTNVTNALFVGSTAELSKLLKNQKEDKDLNNKKK